MSRERAAALVLSCEHGGNRVPARWRRRFDGAARVLAGHRGWDPGALDVARRLARRLDVRLHATTVSRLLVEANRSLGHPRLFSEFVRDLPEDERALLLDRYWSPHRDGVTEAVAGELAAGRGALHVSVHTFTPVLDGRRRDVDVGLLFDPSRPAERSLAEAWRARLRTTAPGLRVRFNRPYRGDSDGLAPSLRARFPGSRYRAVELEIGQRFFDAAGRPRARHRATVRAIEDALVAGMREATGT